MRAVRVSSSAWWRWFLALAVPVGVVYFAVPGPVSKVVFWGVAGAAPVIAILVGVWRHRPERPLPWLLFALGQAMFVTGDMIFYVHDYLLHSELPVPSVADLFYLATYPCLISGLLLLARARSQRADRIGLADVLIIMVSTGVLSWVFLMVPYLHDASLGTAERLTSLAYPLADVALLSVVARLWTDGGRRNTSFGLLTASLVPLLLADTAYGLIQLHGDWHLSSPVDLGWLAFYAAFGAAALHPSMRELGTPAPAVDGKVTRLRFGVLLAFSSLLAPVIIAIEAARGEPIDVIVVVAGALVLFVLVLVRISRLVGALERLHRLQGESRVQRLMQDVSDVITFCEIDTTIRYQTQSVARVLGWSPAELAGSRLLDLVHEEDLVRVEAEFAAIGETGAGAPVVCRLRRRDGTWVATETIGAVVIDGGRRGVLLTTRDIGERVRAEEAVREHHRQLVEAQRIARVGNWEWHLPTDRVDGSEQFYRLMGLESGRPLHAAEIAATLIRPEDRPAFQVLADRLAGDPSPKMLDVRIVCPDGTERTLSYLGEGRCDEAGRVVRVVGTCQDITERKMLEERLTYQAFHDDLTGLANRALFVNRTQHAMARRGHGSDTQLAVLLLDLDDFKDLNDSLGHTVGDALLCSVAERLQCVRATDTLARLGGDEFALLLDDTLDSAVVSDVAERLLQAMRIPFTVQGREIQLSASIGIALTDPDRVQDADELLRNADMAMYLAKRHGKGRSEYFAPGMHSAAVRKLELIADLRRAVGAEEFVVHYQPIVELRTARVVAVEALVRWQHPDRGLVSPLEFIPQAEESGLIVPIGRAVLAAACAQTAHWRRLHPEIALTVNVNLSVRQIEEPDLMGDLTRILAESGLPPSALTLEVTESVLTEDRMDAAERLWAIKRLGVRLAIDDFGTGYSSLSRLRDLPIDSLKIPKPFVDGITRGAEDSAMARAIIDLASVLSLQVVAEGIEHPAQWRELSRLGCERGQGYYFAKPVAAEHVPALLESGRLDQQHRNRTVRGA